MKIILYTIGCPKCKVLETKLKQKDIKFETCEDVQEILKVGNENHILSAPILFADDKYMDFATAIKWANGREAV